MPMMRGSTPADAAATMRALGVSPNRFTACSVAMSSAQAPSFTPEALPAVTEPFALNGVESFASCSSVVSRGCSSLLTMSGAAFFC